MSVRLSVCLSVCLSGRGGDVGVLSGRIAILGVYAGVVLSVNACVIVRLGEFVCACVCVMSVNACVIVCLSVYLSRVCVCFECECVA